MNLQLWGMLLDTWEQHLMRLEYIDSNATRPSNTAVTKCKRPSSASGVCTSSVRWRNVLIRTSQIITMDKSCRENFSTTLKCVTAYSARSMMRISFRKYTTKTWSTRAIRPWQILRSTVGRSLRTYRKKLRFTFMLISGLAMIQILSTNRAKRA